VQAVKNRCRVLLADDHAMFAETLRGFLSTKYDVVGVVADGKSLIDAAEKLRPDVAVVDVGMRLPNGFNAGCQLKKQQPSIKLVCVTLHSEPAMAAEAFRHGASAFLVKSSTASELVSAIEEALEDRIYISPLVAKEVMLGLLKPRKQRRSGDALLTARQKEVLQLLAEGKSMKMIAETLNISARTVQFHKYKMMKILRVTTNSEIVQYAIKHGMLST
jgi:DNA-binding NarL/FixJ family response regulator